MDKDRVLAKLAEKAGVVQRVMATDDGKRLMEILRKEFFTSTAAKDADQIVFNAGRADVVAYLMQLQNFTPEG